MRIIPLLTALLACHALWADELVDALAKAEEMARNKHYWSAYQLVDKADPDRLNPDAVAFQASLLRKNFVARIGPDMVALRDLKPDERIEDVRGGEGTFDMVLFETAKELGRLLEDHPDHGRLNRELGLYYHKLHAMEPDAEGPEGKSAFEAAVSHLSKAVDAGAGDDECHFSLGHLLMSDGRFAESIPQFEKCLEYNTDHAAAHFNLASALLHENRPRKALPRAKSALELYDDPGLQCDAASLCGDIHAELGNDKEALRLYELADRLSPGAYPNIKSLLRMRLRFDAPEADETSRKLMALDPQNPTVFSDLEEVHTRERKTDALVAFYQHRIDEPADDDTPVVTGNLHFFLARLLVETDEEKARRHFGLARGCFEKGFPADHPVFRVIDHYLAGDDKEEP